MTHADIPPDSELRGGQSAPTSNADASEPSAAPAAAGKAAAPSAVQRALKLGGAGVLAALAIVAVGMNVNSGDTGVASCPMCALGARVVELVSGTPTCGMEPADAPMVATRPSPASSVSYVTAASFQAEVLEASQPVLVKFTARWCSQCQLMKPVVDAVATDRAADVRVVMLDVERDEELARQLGVDALPTFMVYRGGEVVATQVGAYGREGLERLLGEAGL